MMSIQSQLIRRLSLAMVILSLITGGLLYVLLRRSLTLQFDRTLEAQASAIRSLVSIKNDGKMDVDFNALAMPEYRNNAHTQFFVLQQSDGKPITSSPNLPDSSINWPTSVGKVEDFNLNGVGCVRVLRNQFTPLPEHDHDNDSDETLVTPPTTSRDVVLIVARNRLSLDDALNRLGVSIAISTGLLSFTAVLFTLLIVRKGLSSVRNLAEEVQTVDFTNATARLNAATLPAELRPVAERLNELLLRVNNAFARERRFTADVAHELRTPIAELRTATEIALKWPDNIESTQRALHHAKDIAIHMQTMVATLLTIVRNETNDDTIDVATIDVLPLIQQSIDRHQQLAKDRSLILDISIPDHFRMIANPSLLSAIIDNLITNAFRYAPDAGHVTIRGLSADSRLVLIFENTNDTLTPDDMSQIFNPFWRKDMVRSNSQNLGLGLSLVRTLCHVMKINILAELNADLFKISMDMPAET